jgi:hypothetical protein
MRTMFGYIPSTPLPTGRTREPFDSKDRSIFLRGMGVHPVASAAAAFMETRISRDLHRWFVQCVKNKPEEDYRRSPQLHNWDIINGSPSAVTHPSLQHLRIARSSQQSALLELKKFKPYWFLFEDSIEECGWMLGVLTAIHALAALRLRQDGKSYREIALLFLCRGVTFQTFQPFQPAAIWVSYHPIPDRLPNRGPGYQFTEEDYHIYLHHRNVLLGHPRTRGALLRGGILWRLAASSLQIEDVLEGPTNSSTALSIAHPISGEVFIDDSLSKAEEALLVGAYVCYTGNGAEQISIKSWWPLPEIFEKAEDLGYWSSFNETWYQKRLDLIRKGKAVPLSKRAWREELRGRVEPTSLRINTETRSRACLERLAPGASSHLGGRL